MKKEEIIKKIINREPLKISGAFYFIEPIIENNGDIIDGVKETLKRYRKLYEAIILFTSTIYFFGLSASQAIRFAFRGASNKTIVNLGSGPSSFANTINVDIAPYENVDVIANVLDLPFKDGSVDMVVSESLLEHVPSIEKAIEEISRIIKPEGFVYIEMPFMFPYHNSPGDFSRLTLEGLRENFKDFKVLKSGTRSGPIAALVIIFMYTIAMILSFGSRKLYSAILTALMVILSPLKIFDQISRIFPYSSEAANHIYFFAVKK